MVIFSKIEFILNDKVLMTVAYSTLPEAINAAKDLKPIENFKMSISCYY
jgi:hypothetical protein